MKIAFLCPMNGISGGLFVVYRQAHFLAQQGHDVEVIFSQSEFGKTVTTFPDFRLPTYFLSEVEFGQKTYDVVVATWWMTFYEMFRLSSAHHMYFVQSDERRFYAPAHPTVPWVDWTYRCPQVGYITEARWIQRRLKVEFGQEAFYAPNGIDVQLFRTEGRRYVDVRRPTILLEGPLDQSFKRVREAYQIADEFRKKTPGTRVVLVTGTLTAEVQSWSLDEVHVKIPLAKMPEIYRSADVLLKLSAVEGFVGPPLEAMACGCGVITTRVTGFEEYLEHEKNALLVDVDDFEGAAGALKRWSESDSLRQQLFEGGLQTAHDLDWSRQSLHFQKALESFCLHAREKIGEKWAVEGLPEKIQALNLSRSARLGKEDSFLQKRRGRPLLIFLHLSQSGGEDLLPEEDLRSRVLEGLGSGDRVVWCVNAARGTSLRQKFLEKLGAFDAREIFLEESDSPLRAFLKIVRQSAPGTLVSYQTVENAPGGFFWQAARDHFLEHEQAAVVYPAWMNLRGELKPQLKETSLRHLLSHGEVASYSVFDARHVGSLEELMSEWSGVELWDAFWLRLKFRGASLVPLPCAGEHRVSRSLPREFWRVWVRELRQGEFWKRFFRNLFDGTQHGHQVG